MTFGETAGLALGVLSIVAGEWVSKMPRLARNGLTALGFILLGYSGILLLQDVTEMKLQLGPLLIIVGGLIVTAGGVIWHIMSSAHADTPIVTAHVQSPATASPQAPGAIIRVGPNASVGTLHAEDNVVFGNTQFLDNEGHINAAELNRNRLNAGLAPIKIERTAELGDLSNADLKRHLKETVAALRTLQQKDSDRGGDRAKCDKEYQESLAQGVLLLQSEILWRLQSLRITMAPPVRSAQWGALHVLSGKMTGAKPFSGIADYLDYLGNGLPG